LREEKFDIVGEEYSHACGIVGVEDFLEVVDVLDCEGTGKIEFGLELTEVFSFEAYSVHLATIDTGIVFVGTVSEFL
jgi:hypothetical protein